MQIMKTNSRNNVPYSPPHFATDTYIQSNKQLMDKKRTFVKINYCVPCTLLLCKREQENVHYSRR